MKTIGLIWLALITLPLAIFLLIYSGGYLLALIQILIEEAPAAAAVIGLAAVFVILKLRREPRQRRFEWRK